jgi:hypothetical protein
MAFSQIGVAGVQKRPKSRNPAARPKRDDDNRRSPIIGQ